MAGDRNLEIIEKIREEKKKCLELSSQLNKERERYVKLLGRQPKKYVYELPIQSMEQYENNTPNVSRSTEVPREKPVAQDTTKVEDKPRITIPTVEVKKESIVEVVKPVEKPLEKKIEVEPMKPIEKIPEPEKTKPVETLPKIIEPATLNTAPVKQVEKKEIKKEDNVILQRIESTEKQQLEHIAKPKQTKNRKPPSKRTDLLSSVRILHILIFS